MAVDNKNIVRLDLNEIYNAARRKSFIAVRALNAQSPGKYHEDDYAISGNEVQELHDSVMEGAALISNYASMVKHYTQTGIDALTYYEDLEIPTEAATYTDPDADVEGDETITSPDGNEIMVGDIQNRQHSSGEKLSRSIGDLVLFSVDDLEDDQVRYTVVQQFIRQALIAFVLYKWFALNGVGEQAAVHYQEFERAAGDVRFSSVRNHRRRHTRRPTGPIF